MLLINNNRIYPKPSTFIHLMKSFITIKIVSSIIFIFYGFNAFATNKKDTTDNYFVFSYFYGNERQNDGLHLAVSTDGLNWQPIKNDHVIFHPGFGERFRDPTLIYDVHDPKLIHMLWTTERKDGFGIASSYNLTDWFDVREVIINKNVEGVLNTWAPELIWDTESNNWIVYWGSSIKGRFPETAVLSKNPKANNRMYYAKSSNLKDWSEPVLMHDYGFPSTDCFIFKLPVNHPRGKYVQFVKQIEKPGSLAYIQMAFSDSIAGDYILNNQFVSRKYKFSEGPNVFYLKGYYYLILDLSQEHRMSIFRTKQIGITEWEDLTHVACFPKEAKHGTVLRISKELYVSLTSK